MLKYLLSIWKKKYMSGTVLKREFSIWIIKFSFLDESILFSNLTMCLYIMNAKVTGFQKYNV